MTNQKQKKQYNKPVARKAISDEVESGVIAFQPNRILFLNPSIMALTGFTRKELLETGFESIVHAEDQDAFRQRILLLIQSQKTIQNWKIRIITKQKTMQWVKCNFSVILQNGEKIVIGSIEITTLPNEKTSKKILVKGIT